MKATRLKRYLGEESGAVAATYALALIPLVAFAGVAFDYARVMGMDSELQNGADQAALAAASQLDGQAGACERAANAASGMLQNLVVLSSDSQFVTLTSETACDATGQIRFYQDKAKSQAADSDANARFVEIFVDGRSVDYFLLPVTGLLASPSIEGVAFAGLGSAICKVPPVMMCNPAEDVDPDFTITDYVGHGIRLITQDGGGTYGKGVFGYLETDAGSGANVTKQLIGAATIPGDCVSTEGADIKPGLQLTVMDFLNTRFDIYANGLNTVCGADGAGCPPSANSKTDFLKGGSSTQCTILTGNGSNGYKQGVAPYRPTSDSVPLDAATAAGLSPMGYPRDMCHAVSLLGTCGGSEPKIGDGVWDRDAYFLSNKVNWGTVPDYMALFGTAEPTRYQVYKYEYDNGLLEDEPDVSGPLVNHGRPVCTPPGVPVAGTLPDRRVLSVAIINCVANAVGPNTTNAPIEKYVDVFLVEPSANRGSGGNSLTEKSDVYIEIIGETSLGGGATEGQNIKKDVPYLIE